MDGERKKRREKRVGDLLENQEHLRNVNGREKETETIQTARRMTRSLKETGTGRGTGTEKSVSEGPGTKAAGGEDQPRKLLAGEIQVAEMIGMTGAETTGGI